MKRSCKYCFSYHDAKFDCGRKPVRKKFGTSKADKFRNTKVWRDKSVEIRERDKGLCQICIRSLYNTTTQYTFDNVHVHHIVPLHEDLSKGLDNTNLLSVCRYHHYMCDGGTIPRQEQLIISQEQEDKNKLLVERVEEIVSSETSKFFTIHQPTQKQQKED